MKNYLTYAGEWARVKGSVQVHYERLQPVLTAIIAEHERISGQRIEAETLEMGLPEKLAFYPFWGGWAFKFDVGWSSTPRPEDHWNITLSQAKEVEDFLASLEGEEEVKLLFRRWTEHVCSAEAA